MAKGNVRPIIIVKKKKKGGHGHHGGAWKVAYADFVTAMMAFFMVMWLVAAVSKEQRAAIFDYFKNPSMEPGKSAKPAPGQMGPGGASTSPINLHGGLDAMRPAITRQRDVGGTAAPVLSRNDASQDGSSKIKTPDHTMNPEDIATAAKEAEHKQLEALMAQLREAVDKSQALEPCKDQLLLDITPEGVRIQIVDAQNRPMFDVGSAHLRDYTTAILRELAPYLDSVPNRISLTGHTDMRPYPSNNGYTNWELSADRANAARRALVAGGLPDQKISRVVGLSSSVLFDKTEPQNPINRRISIVVMTKQAEQAALATDVAAAETPAEPTSSVPAGAPEAAPTSAPAVPATAAPAANATPAPQPPAAPAATAPPAARPPAAPFAAANGALPRGGSPRWRGPQGGHDFGGWHLFVPRHLVIKLQPRRLRPNENPRHRRRINRRIQRPRRNERYRHRSSEPKHPTPANLTKLHRKALCLRHLVVLHQRLTPQPSKFRRCEKHVGPVRGAARPAASGAMAIHEQVRFAFHLICHRATQTAPLRHPFLSRNHRPLHPFHPGLGRILLNLWQGVPDLVERRIRPGEDVLLRLDSQLPIEIARRNQHQAMRIHENRRHRPARTADRPQTTQHSCVFLDVVLPRNPPESRQRGTDVSRKRRTMMFATHRAMTMSHRLKRPVHFIPDGPAQTLSHVIHLSFPSAKALLRAASNSSPGFQLCI